MRRTRRLINDVAQVYLSSNYSIKAMLQRLLLSEQFLQRRQCVPALFVAGGVRGACDQGNRLARACRSTAPITPLANMGQQLYEPPDVNGWALGAEWFSTASMLSRMNFAATLAGNQKFNLARDAQPYRQSPERVLEFLLQRFQNAGFTSDGYAAILDYLKAGGAWTGSDAQLNTKVAGAARLIVGAGEYQFD